jgi:hypothetical protein
MAQSTKKSRQEGIAVEEIVALQARVTAGQLQAEDLSRLSKLLELLLTLLQMIEQPKLKLRQLRIRYCRLNGKWSGKPRRRS